MITVNCSTGKCLPLSQIEKYPSKLKAHSMLEIDRVEKSIKEDGLCFPITVGRVNEKYYIIDGEATYLALKQIPQEEVPEIPVVIVRCDEQKLKKLILISASTNHSVSEYSLKQFTKDTNLNLKDYGFPTYDLIDFHTDVDIGLYVETIGGKYNKSEVKESDFEGLLAEFK